MDDIEIEEQLIALLTDGAVFVSGQLDTLCVNCNDLFWWATADAEPITFADIPTVWERWRANTLEEWVCVRRGLRPQAPIEHDWRRIGRWTPELDALPKPAPS